MCLDSQSAKLDFAIDSRLRGNDGYGRGSDGYGCRNDGMDGGMNLRHGRTLPPRRNLHHGGIQQVLCMWWLLGG